MYLTFTNDKEMLRLRSDRIVCVTSDGNYSTISMADGDEKVVTSQIGQIETMMDAQLGSEANNFIRIGRGLIINLEFVYYINPSKQQLVLCDSNGINKTLSASKDALRQLKELFDNGNLK